MKKKNFAMLAALLLILALGGVCALAEDLPQLGEQRLDAGIRDFAGSWYLRWIRSEGAVDLQQYGYIDVYPGGSISVCLGDDEAETYYMTMAEEVGDGCLFAPDGKGGGLYLFLFDEVLGCAWTLDAPQTVYYMEFSGEIDEEMPEEQRIAQLIAGYIGERVYEAEPQAYEGSWLASTCTNDNGGLYYLKQTAAEMEICIDGESAAVTYAFAGEETAYETSVSYESDCAVILDEYGEAEQVLILCADGSLALLDDPAYPSDVIFFLRPERWEEETADIPAYADPEPGEQMDIESLDALLGTWTATHMNVYGMIYPVRAMELESTVRIEEDGMICLSDGDSESFAASEIVDGALITTEPDGFERCFLLFEGGYLMEANEPGDLSVLVYYQRMDEQ